MIKFSTLCTLMYLAVCVTLFVPRNIYNYLYTTDVILVFLILLWILMVVLFYLMTKNIPINNIDSYLFGKNVLGLWFVTIIIVIYSVLKYNQSIFSFVNDFYYYIVLCWYFLFSFLIDSKKKLDCFKENLVKFVVILHLIGLLQVYLLQGTSYECFYLDILIMPIICFEICNVKRTNKNLYLLSTILTGWYVLFIYDNAAIMIIFGVMIAYIIYSGLFKYQSNKFKKSFIITSIILIIFFTPIIIDSIIKFIKNDIGVTMRVYAIKYYITQFFDSPVFGMGFINPSWGETYEELLRGGLNVRDGYNQYYREDVGIIGFINQFGLLGIIWMVRLINNIKKTLNNVENLGIVLVLIIMCISLLPIDKAPIIILPIALLLLEKNALFN